MRPSRTVFKAYFGKEAQFLRDADYERIDNLFEQYKCNPETFCRFVMCTRVPEYIYAEWVLSNAIQAEFAKWIKEQETTIPITAGLELESFYARMNFEGDPLKVIHDEHLDISPLLRYLVGMFLGLDNEVLKYKKRASQQLIEYPWYAKVFYKFAEFFPPEIPYDE